MNNKLGLLRKSVDKTIRNPPVVIFRYNYLLIVYGYNILHCEESVLDHLYQIRFKNVHTRFGQFVEPFFQVIVVFNVIYHFV